MTVAVKGVLGVWCLVVQSYSESRSEVEVYMSFLGPSKCESISLLYSTLCFAPFWWCFVHHQSAWILAPKVMVELAKQSQSKPRDYALFAKLALPLQLAPFLILP